MAAEPDKWDLIERVQLEDCRVFRVSKRRSRNGSSGEEADFFVVECPDWVNVVPVTENGEAVLIEQFRHGTGELTLEIPGGMVDEGESAAECAVRELAEETGFTASELHYLGRSRPNPAIQDNWIYHFAATGCRKTADPRHEGHESIAARLVPIEELWGKVASGEISHSLVVAGIALFREHFQRREDNL